MQSRTDETIDPQRRSWVPDADGHADFPIQNLPLGVFSPRDQDARGGVAIGNRILDLRGLGAAGVLTGDAARAAEAGSGSTLNTLLGLGAGPRRALRRQVSQLLSLDSTAGSKIEPLLHDTRQCDLQLPAAI